VKEAAVPGILRRTEPPLSAEPIRSNSAKGRPAEMHVLYIFAGLRRRSDIAECLQRQAPLGITIVMTEIDILRDATEGNVLDVRVFSRITADLTAGKYACAILTPPCNTWSRATFSNKRGPCPVRDRAHPWGYPWLQGHSAARCSDGNEFIHKVMQCARLAHAANTHYLIEHPEDLGTLANGLTPASIWQLPEIASLANDTHAITAALHQCDPLADKSCLVDYPKPTRLLSTLRGLRALPHQGWPRFSSQGGYIGPLPRHCGHNHSTRLTRSQHDCKNLPFRTSATAAYPPMLCSLLATFIIEGIAGAAPFSPSEGERRQKGAERGSNGRHVVGPSSDNGCLSQRLSTRPRAHDRDLFVTKLVDWSQMHDYRRQEGAERGSNGTPSAALAEEKPCNKEPPSASFAEEKEKPLPSTGTPTGTPDAAPAEEKTPNAAAAEEECTSDEDENGDPRPPLGAGHYGKGPPLLTRWSGRPRAFHDGAGLCSPGRWPPHRRRPLPGGGAARLVRDAILAAVRKLPDPDRLVYRLATGNQKVSPFPDEMLAALRRDVACLLAERFPGTTSDSYLIVHDYQPFYLNMLSGIMQDINDPDWRQLTLGRYSYSKGVPIGVNLKMPRTPSVYERKIRWRTLDQSDYVPDRDNYSSAKEAAPQLEKLFQADAAQGMMFEEQEDVLRRLYPGDMLRVASLGAIAKGDHSFRVIHDGTHGVHINSHVKPRDQVRMPGPGEERVVLQHCSTVPGVHFALKADIAQAHRRFRNREQDWGLQACRLRPGTLWVNRVGTFGVGSACYWWSRLAALLARFALYMLEDAHWWQLIFADDLKWNAHGPRKYEHLLCGLLAWVLVGAPFAWRKCRGGIEIDWVGYWIDYGRFELGISESRSAWLTKWLGEILDTGAVLIRRLVEGLGRLGFAAGVLEWHRPFLAPLYAWTAAAPHGAYLPLPPMVALVLSHLRGRLLAGARTVRCLMPTREPDLVFRADAKAEGKTVVLGGWECRDRTPTGAARWFSLEITEVQAPWFFPKGEPYRAIAALELMATVTCVMLFTRPEHRGQHGVMHLISGGTDNKGNSYVVSKLMSNRYPLNVVAMELASQLETTSQWLDLVWTPREDNHEADQLTNGEFTGFDPDRRIKVSFAELPFLVLHELMVEGKRLEGQLADLKSKRSSGEEAVTPGAPRRAGRRALRGSSAGAHVTLAKKRRREGRMRETDPW
jgi:hypothetical protein